jgi:L-seryl-tRNA(Ser) seleniumtransferase
MMYLTREEIASRAARLAEKVSALPGFAVELEDGESVIGGGSTPGQTLPTRLVAITHARLSAQEIEAALRRNSPPVIGRIERDRLLLDLRTVFEEQEQEIVRAFQRLTAKDER